MLNSSTLFSKAMWFLYNDDCDLLCENNQVETNYNLYYAILADHSPVKFMNNSININQGYVSNRGGFKIVESEGTILSCNGVYIANNSPACPAFNIKSSRNVMLECNIASNSGIGFQIEGSNFGTDFLTNTMDNCYKGLYLNPVGIIDIQDSKGNLYLNNFTYGAHHDGTDFYINRSEFVVNNSNSSDFPRGTIYSIYTPNKTNSTQWFFVNGSLPTCAFEPNECTPFQVSLNNSSDHSIVNWPNNSEWYNETSRHYAQRFLFDKLFLNPELMVNDEDLNTFYEDHLNSEVGFFEFMQSKMDTLFRPLKAEIQLMDSFHIQFSTIFDSIESFDSEYTGFDANTLLSDLNARKILYDSLLIAKSSFDYVLENIKSRAIDSAEIYLDLYSNFTCSNLYSQYERDVNVIILSMLIENRAKPDSLEELTLHNIADLCSYEFGKAVLKSRAILSLTSEQDQNDENLCFQESIILGSNKFNSNLSNYINIFPNPVHDEVFWSMGTIPEYYTVSLTNIFGKLLYTSKFYGTSGSIYTSNLCSGIYYISFNFERKKLSKRIIIN